MRHLLTCVLAVTAAVLYIGSDFANGQYSKASIPGYKIKIVGCFKENPKSRNIPTVLFSDTKGVNSKTKIDYKNFAPYITGAVGRCAKATKAKSFAFFAMSNIGDCVSGKVSTSYAKLGSSKNCKNGAGVKCGKSEDCVGDAKSNFVYKLESLPTTPTKKPTTKVTTKKPSGASTSAKPTTVGPAAKLNALTCQNFLVAIKASSGASPSKPAIPTPSKKPTAAAGKSTGPTAATPSTPSTTSGQSAIEAKVKSIYKGYTCLTCLRTVNASSSTVFLMLQFTCQGQHLKKLVAGLGASNIVKAECYPPACAGSNYPCPSPCGMSTCPWSPTMGYPSICPAPAPPPAPLPPPQCPMSCPSVCAPACNSFCCRSMIRHKSITGQSAKKSSTEKADDFDDDDADDEEDDEYDENDDDTDIDETN